MNRFSDRLITVLIAGTIILIILSAYSSEGTGRQDAVPDKLNLQVLQSGDLIFRNGKGMISNGFRLTSRKQPLYSHAGIVHKQNGKTFVIHLIDGGSAKGKIRMESIDRFCDPVVCHSFGIYRSNIEPGNIDRAAMELYRSGVSFDSKFDLATSDQMYCTEMVYRVLEQASTSFFIPLNTISGKTYVACDDLFLADGTKLIYQHQY